MNRQAPAPLRAGFRLAWFAAALAPLGAGPPGPITFEDITPRSGVDFRYEAGETGRHNLPEIMGGGVALIDGDGDGRLDLYFCNGGPFPGGGPDATPCRYYRNNGDGTFTDATGPAGAPGPDYAMGAAVADFDNDGRDDLFVTGWRGQRLYRNTGGGRFLDVTDRAGLASHLWSTAAAWADLDADGDLDLVVVNYLEYDPETAPFCAAPDGRRDYCGPEDFPAQPDRLYRNNGDGTFTDVAREAGFDRPDGRGLGVLVADLTGDPRPDVFVANDGSPCRLFENLGGFRFREAGEAAGVAVDGRGQALAGMGVAAGDLLGNGRTDLVVTNFLGRSTVGFVSLGGLHYRDDSAPLGLAVATRDVLGFGVALVDLDADGQLDLVQANGHVLDRARLGTPAAMRPTLLHNLGGRFEDVAAGAGPAFARASLGRGLAVGDLDNDGRPDLVLASLDAPPALLRNTSPGRSMAVELRGRNGCQPFGARLRAESGGRAWTRVLPGGGSYLSSSGRRIYLPFGKPGKPASLRFGVTWPSGRTEAWDEVPAAPVVRLTEGTGR